MTPDKLDLPHLIALGTAATPAPWEHATDLLHLGESWLVRDQNKTLMIPEDAAFIAEVRNAFPAIVAELQECERLRAEVERLTKGNRELASCLHNAWVDYDQFPHEMATEQYDAATRGVVKRSDGERDIPVFRLSEADVRKISDEQDWYETAVRWMDHSQKLESEIAELRKRLEPMPGWMEREEGT